MNRGDFLRIVAGTGIAAVAKGAYAEEPPRKGSRNACLDGGTFDVVVIGGSTTGVFAAVRAAEKGMRVALVENNAVFGGTATAGFVPVWHSMHSMSGRRIVGGLTQLVVERMTARGEAESCTTGGQDGAVATSLNTAALSFALDELVAGHSSITPMLSTRFVAAETDRPGHVTRVFIEDKDGRKALSAKFFIDCSGDADLVHRAGFETWKLPPCDLQAHTLCAIVANGKAVRRRHPKFSFQTVLDPTNGGGFDHVFGWSHPVVGCPEVEFNAFTRVSGYDPSVASDLTKATLEARRQLKAIVDHANRLFPMPDGEPKLAVVAIAPMLGIRESRHVKCLYSVTREDVLTGRSFDDCIARGTYRIDIHEKEGIRFLNLDGTEDLMRVNNVGRVEWVHSRWRPESDGVTDHYEIPYRAIVPKGSENVLCAGRMLDCSRDAYGALRVMVNCNQMGEAAGLAAANAVRNGLSAEHAFTRR